MSPIPMFTADGLLPPGDFEVTLSELRSSVLVRRPGALPEWLNWDCGWREMLVQNLEVLVRQLWRVGVTEIFVDGSFAEDKDHPNDIDGYFECDLKRLASGELERELNVLDPHKVWTWDPASRRPYIRRSSFRCGISTGSNSIPIHRDCSPAFVTSTVMSWSFLRRSGSHAGTASSEASSR